MRRHDAAAGAHQLPIYAQPPIEEIIEEARATAGCSSSSTTRTARTRAISSSRRRWRRRDAINFMAKHGRGLICLALTADRVRAAAAAADERSTTPRATRPPSPSRSRRREGVTTGISAHDRAHTVAVAIDPTKGPNDIVTPGHVFPLMARDGGVLVRTGHTEAAVDIARLAGPQPLGRDLRDHERRRHHGARCRISSPSRSSTGSRSAPSPISSPIAAAPRIVAPGAGRQAGACHRRQLAAACLCLDGR